MLERITSIFRRETQEPAPAEAERVEPTVSNLADGETFPSSDRVKMGELFMVDNTPAGAVVNEASAMRVSAVYACARLIAGAIAGLPVHAYERDDDGRKRIQHDYWWLLNEQPNPAFSASTFWEYECLQMMFRGDAICYLVRNRAGNVTSILPFPRGDVAIQKRKKESPKEPDRLIYGFRTDEGVFGADQDDVLHFPGFGFNGLSGLSVIKWGARNSIGTAIKADEFAGKFFAQGAVPQFAVTTAGEFSEEQQEQFVKSWNRKYSGNGPNGMPLILTEGLSVKELTMSAEDAQLLESRKWQVVDIARAFGVPPFMIGESEKSTSWGSGLEQMGTGFVMYTLMPYLNRIKHELNRKLFRTSRYFLEHNVDALVRGDLKTRADYFKAAIGGTQNPGWLTVNEIRRMNNDRPIEGGDELYRPEKGNESEASSRPGEEPDDDGGAGGGQQGSSS